MSQSSAAIAATTAPCPPAGETPLLEKLIGKVESLEGILNELRQLFIGKRKDNYVVEEIATLTGRSEYTVRRWISEGRLKAIRVSEGGPRGRLLVPRAELERLISAGKGENIPEVSLDGACPEPLTAGGEL